MRFSSKFLDSRGWAISETVAAVEAAEALAGKAAQTSAYSSGEASETAAETTPKTAQASAYSAGEASQAAAETTSKTAPQGSEASAEVASKATPKTAAETTRETSKAASQTSESASQSLKAATETTETTADAAPDTREATRATGQQQHLPRLHQRGLHCTVRLPKKRGDRSAWGEHLATRGTWDRKSDHQGQETNDIPKPHQSR